MMDSDKVYISQIGNAIKQIMTYLLEASTNDFMRSKMLQDAVLRQLEVAGQACNKLSHQFRQKTYGISYGQLLGVEYGIVAAATNKEESVTSPESLADVEREHIKKTLNYTCGNHTKAAQILGISRVNLISKIKNYKLE